VQRAFRYERAKGARPACIGLSSLWATRGWRLRGDSSERGRVRRWEGRSPDCRHQHLAKFTLAATGASETKTQSP
jgi:hypothetical protein